MYKLSCSHVGAPTEGLWLIDPTSFGRPGLPDTPPVQQQAVYKSGQSLTTGIKLRPEGCYGSPKNRETECPLAQSLRTTPWVSRSGFFQDSICSRRDRGGTRSIMGTILGRFRRCLFLTACCCWSRLARGGTGWGLRRVPRSVL